MRTHPYIDIRQPCPHRRTRRGGGGGGGQVPPQFGKNDLFGQNLILFGQLSSVLKFIKGAFECCPKIY